MVTTIAPQLTRNELRVVRGPKCANSLLAKLKSVYRSTQVSHRGRYSIERLVALGEYTQRTSRLRVVLVCVGTPLPMIAFVLSLECVPLQDPKNGWQANYGFWIRTAVVCGVIAYTMLVELRHLIEGVTISLRQTVLVVVCVVVGNTAFCVTAAANFAFPIPFMSILMVPPLLCIVAGSLRIAFGTKVFTKILAQSAQIWGAVLFVFAQALTLMIYPIYQVAFDAALGSHYELPVTMLLPIVKMMMKNIVASSIDHMEDMMPESVTFTVDFFNAVYVATCMQQTSSTITVVVIMLVDTFHIVLALRGLHLTACEIRRLSGDREGVQGGLKVLDVGCLLCQHIEQFESQNYTCIQLRSCLPHVVSAPGQICVSRLEKYSLKPVVSASSMRTGTVHLSRGWKRASTSGSAMQCIPVIPDQPDSTSTQSLSSFSESPSCILQRTVEVLFMTECFVLTEYLEAFIPIFYASFLCVMAQLPSAQYHTELEGITRETVGGTVQSVFLYGLLECTSFLVLILVIHRTIGMHVLYHLAFVLETQTSLIQSKLIVWMLLMLTCRVVHYGFDFTFQFSWIDCCSSKSE